MYNAFTNRTGTRMVLLKTVCTNVFNYMVDYEKKKSKEPEKDGMEDDEESGERSGSGKKRKRNVEE